MSPVKDAGGRSRGRWQSSPASNRAPRSVDDDGVKVHFIVLRGDWKVELRMRIIGDNEAFGDPQVLNTQKTDWMLCGISGEKLVQ